MALKWIFENATVYYIPRKQADGWGIKEPSSDKQKLGCTVRPVEDSTPITSLAGKQVVPSFTITLNGNILFGAGDILEVDGIQKPILHLRKVKDLSGIVIFTKVTV